MKKTGSDQQQWTFRLVLECLDAHERQYLIATWTPRGSGLPTEVKWEWVCDIGPGLRAQDGEEVLPLGGEGEFIGAEQRCLLKAVQDMLNAVTSGRKRNVVAPAPAPRRRARAQRGHSRSC